MKLSRKPRTLIITMLVAVFLMTMAGIAMAVPAIHWGFNSGASISNVTGTVYDDVAGDVYATVYATVYNQLRTIPLLTDASITSAKSFNLPLGYRGLRTNQDYDVTLTVYYGGTTPVDLASALVTATRSFRYVESAPSSSSSGGSYNPDADLPIIPASFGQPVAVTAAQGATIAGTGYSITIPAGALLADVNVTITKVAETAGLTLPEGGKLLGDVLEIIKDKSGDFTKPVTLTINFDKSQVDLTKFDVKVCFWDETDKTWVPLDNIKVDETKGTVSGDVTHFTKFAVLAVPKVASTPAPAVSLSDISGHWAEASIQQLVYAGAITGYPDGTFKPDNTITRAEFATVLVKAFKLTAQEGKAFDDTASHWAKDYIATAAAAGIVNGYSATAFGPDDLITREQMAVMIARAADLTKATAEVTFTDKAKIASWAADAVASASEAQIITGYPDNSFKPQGNATRAEAVTVIVKAIK